jgi:hypothetical protein
MLYYSLTSHTLQSHLHVRLKGVTCENALSAHPCVALTFALSDSKQEVLYGTTKLCLAWAAGVNGCEGRAVCSVVSVWDPISEDSEGCVIKKESAFTEYLWSVMVHVRSFKY